MQLFPRLQAGAVSVSSAGTALEEVNRGGKKKGKTLEFADWLLFVRREMLIVPFLFSAAEKEQYDSFTPHEKCQHHASLTHNSKCSVQPGLDVTGEFSLRSCGQRPSARPVLPGTGTLVSLCPLVFSGGRRRRPSAGAFGGDADAYGVRGPPVRPLSPGGKHLQAPRAPLAGEEHTRPRRSGQEGRLSLCG